MGKVEKTLAELPGVVSAEVDFDNNVANCEVNADEFDPDNAMQQLADAGYPATVTAE